MIREIFPYVEVNNYIYQIGWDFYNYLFHLYNSKQNDKRLLELPKEVAKKCMLEPVYPKRIYLKDFLDNLGLLEKSINQKIILEKISFISKFYFDISFAKKHLLEKIEDLKNDILLIYRLRNKIVHKAHYDNNILPYYIQKIEKYSSTLLQELLSGYKQNNKITQEEIFSKRYIHSKIIISKLENGVSIDFFEKVN